MRITPDVIRCELIGTQAKVAESSHSGHVGLSGKIVDETRNTFILLYKGERRIVQKKSSVFHFTFSDNTTIEIGGTLLVGRPEDRLKKIVRRLW